MEKGCAWLWMIRRSDQGKFCSFSAGRPSAYDGSASPIYTCGKDVLEALASLFLDLILRLQAPLVRMLITDARSLLAFALVRVRSTKCRVAQMISHLPHFGVDDTIRWYNDKIVSPKRKQRNSSGAFSFKK